MEAVTSTRNPFNLPELRHRLSRFVTVNDALSCALVSKAWTQEFVSAVWFKVDFNVHPLFAELSPDIISEHGHHIRVVKDAKLLAQVSALDNANVNKLRVLQMETLVSTMQNVHVYQIVARNNTSLRDLHIYANSALSREPDALSRHVSVPAFVPFTGDSQGKLFSTLETLELTELWLTHDELLTILEASPRLSKLMLSYTQIVGTPTRSFQHLGVTLFSSSIQTVFPRTPTVSPPLLSHFPNVTILHIWNMGPYSIPTEMIKDEITRYCPHLTQFKLEDEWGAIVPEFLTNICSNVTRITFEGEGMTEEDITAILLHQTTLKKVSQFCTQDFDYEKEEVPLVKNNMDRVTGPMMQQIPRSCSQLQTLNLHRHEMCMGNVEAAEWACKNLRKLKIRVKGLETQEKILRAIALWRAGCWRRWQRQATEAK
ncbi:hypothetical protein BGW39_009251 [Mortierella sp. 14UC]|nr:hypothetical protein BGW39_009251 [Mortierella sp. 14UC]